jgi:hypothetical protein
MSQDRSLSEETRVRSEVNCFRSQASDFFTARLAACCSAVGLGPNQKGR